MGQKVNPHGLRVGVIKDWDSRWYAREDKVGDLVVEEGVCRPEKEDRTQHEPETSKATQ